MWKGAHDYVPVGLLEETVLTLPRGKKNQLDTVVKVDGELLAPLQVGDRVGSVALELDGDTVYDAPLVALAEVPPGGFFSRLWDSVLMWIAGLFST